jgi:hypothetical protein
MLILKFEELQNSESKRVPPKQILTKKGLTMNFVSQILIQIVLPKTNFKFLQIKL